MQTRDGRSKFFPPSIKEFYDQGGRQSLFNDRAHANDRNGQHVQRLLYTSKVTLDTVAGTPFYPWFGGYIVGFRVNVATTPVTTALKVDVLQAGLTILNGDFVQVAAGSVFGYLLPPSDRVYLYKDVKYQVQVNTISSAGGPLVLAIEYIPG